MRENSRERGGQSYRRRCLEMFSALQRLCSALQASAQLSYIGGTESDTAIAQVVSLVIELGRSVAGG